MKQILILLLFLGCTSVFSQVGVNTTTPSAAFDVNSATQGVLVSRVALTSKTVAAPVVNPQGGTLANGTLVFNTATAGTSPNNVVPGFYYWDTPTLKWIAIASDANTRSWLVSGNASTNPATDFLGTTDARDLVVKTGNTERMRLTATGNLGLGVTNPTKSLVLNQKSTTDGFQLTGQSISGTGTGTGFTMALGYNVAGNKQMWFGDPDYAGNALGSFLRFVAVGNTSVLDAVAGDGLLRKRLSLGVAGDTNSGIISSNTYINGGLGVGATAGAAALNGTLPSGSLSVDGNIGIGTTTPAYNLHIPNGTFAFGNSSSRTETRDNAGLQGNVGAQSGFFETSAPTNFPTGASSWWHLIDTRHNNPGNNYALQIAGSFFDQDLWFRKTNGSPTTSWSKLLTSNSGWGTTGNAGTNPAANFIGTTDARDFVVRTANTERMRITASGNVGIATSTPWAPLQFDNSIQNRKIVMWQNFNNDHNFYGFGVNSYGLRYQVEVPTSNHIFYAGTSTTTSNELMRITGTGNVGIGVAAPAQRLDIQGGNARINNSFIGDVGHGANWAAFSHYSQANPSGYGLLSAGDGAYTLMNKANTGSGYLGFRVGNADQAVILNNGNMGVGTTNPSKKLTVENGSIRPHIGNFGDAGIQFPTDPGGGGGDEAFIRYYVDGGGENTKLLIGNNNDSDDDISFFQLGAERMTIYSGNVGIGTTTPSFMLHIFNAGTGTSSFSNGTGWFSTSDARLKTNISPMTKYGLSTILQLKPVTYSYKADITNQSEVGFLAQEVQKVIPEVIAGTEGDIAKGETLGIDYSSLVPVLTKAIQEQQVMIEELKKKIEILEEKSNK